MSGANGPSLLDTGPAVLDPDPAVFDLTGPLPTGTTVLEASAGTGKTYTIAGLVTRYVAEGVATVDQLLVVTFGRAATAELRDRVRERLARHPRRPGRPRRGPPLRATPSPPTSPPTTTSPRSTGTG